MHIWNTTSKVCDVINNGDDIPGGYTDKPPLWVMGEYWNGTEWVLDEVTIKKTEALYIISERSRAERISILDDQTIVNILTGATGGYPEYLTAKNVALMIEQFKTVSRNAKAAVSAATSIAEIESIMNSLAFPTEADILAALNN